MNIDDDVILGTVDIFINGKDANSVVSALYDIQYPAVDSKFQAIVNILPNEQMPVLAIADRLNLSALACVVIFLAALRKIRSDESWIHFNLCKNLNLLVQGGVSEAKFPLIIHSLLAIEGLKSSPSGQQLPLISLARELANFSPRQAVRCGMRAARNGDKSGLDLASTALSVLGLDELTGEPAIKRALDLARVLHLSADNIPNTTNLSLASGMTSTLIEPERKFVFPTVSADADHYIFTEAGIEAILPGIRVRAFKNGIFSIDASSPGLEQHYVFDEDKNCVIELAHGTNPFITENIIECDGSLAILDDHFSGVMNICHFLLDRLTRIPIYERAWVRPGKFLVVDDYPYYREIFERMGLADRVIFPASKRVSIRAPKLMMSSNISEDFRHPAHYCSGWAIDYLRRVLNIDDHPFQQGHKILISRADAKGRAVLNWQDVLPIISKYGYKVVELAGMDIEAQIEMFRNASHVIGVHGAGLTNILFAPKECVVLEILPPLVATRAYWLLASKLGQKYVSITADDAEMPRPDYTTWQHHAGYNSRDIVVPLDRLECILASF